MQSGGGSHVCLLLPSARLFVCPVLSVSTLALHFCVGVESDPHLPGLFFSSRSLLFLFPLGLRNLNLRQNIHAPSSSAGGHSQGGGSGKRSRDSGMTSTLFFLTAISLEDKWNHMLAAVLGRKMEQGGKKEGSFSMMLEVGRSLMISSFFSASARRNFNSRASM